MEIDESRCVELNAGEVILEEGAGRKVASVGHFPFIPQVREAAEKLWVLEKRPVVGNLPAEMAAEVLPQADVAANWMRRRLGWINWVTVGVAQGRMYRVADLKTTRLLLLDPSPAASAACCDSDQVSCLAVFGA